MKLRIETEREDDGRWIAEVMELPGVLAYGKDREEAVHSAQALALRVITTGSNTANRPRAKPGVTPPSPRTDSPALF